MTVATAGTSPPVQPWDNTAPAVNGAVALSLASAAQSQSQSSRAEQPPPRRRQVAWPQGSRRRTQVQPPQPLSQLLPQPLPQPLPLSQPL